MKNILVAFLMLFSVSLFGYEGENTYEGDSSGISLRTEVGYTYYGLDVNFVGTSTSTAIAYTVLDFTMGATYFIDRWAFDGYARFVVKELENQMDWDGDTQSDADINRKEYALAISYQISEHLGMFVGYRMSNIEASDNIASFGTLTTDYKYTTKGPSVGINYGFITDSKKHVFNFLGGIAYQEATLDMDANYNNANTGKETEKGFGYVFGMQYRYLIDKNWDFRITGDVYDFNYEDGDKYELEDWTYSGRMGFTYTF